MAHLLDLEWDDVWSDPAAKAEAAAAMRKPKTRHRCESKKKREEFELPAHFVYRTKSHAKGADVGRARAVREGKKRTATRKLAAVRSVE